MVPVIVKCMGKDPVVDIPKACYGKHIFPVPSPFVINMDALLERGWNSGGSSRGRIRGGFIAKINQLMYL